MPTTTFTTAQITNLVELTALVKDVIHMSEDIKARETLLASKKKRLAELLPTDGFAVKDDDGTVINATWVDKLTKTLQKALVEANHNIVLTDADFKQTPSHYVNVARLKK